MLLHKVGLLGQPGSGCSTAGLSYPFVEQHVWGSDEETTALNFHGRTDILKPVKLDWYECLTDVETAKLTDGKTPDKELALITKQGRTRNVKRYWDYLKKLKVEVLTKKRTDIKTIFLDSFSPFVNQFEDYIEIIWGNEFITKEGNFDNIAYYKRFKSELNDFIEFFYAMPLHCVIRCHVEMVAGEEIGANTQFMTAAKMGGVRKEWQPMITGKAKYIFASKPSWAFFLKCEETPGQANKYYAKLEADDSNIGVAKPRVQPYKNPRRITFTKNKFYEEFDQALNSYIKTGQLVDNK